MPCRAAIDAVWKAMPVGRVITPETMHAKINWWHRETIVEVLDLLVFEGRVKRRIFSPGLRLYARVDSRSVFG